MGWQVAPGVHLHLPPVFALPWPEGESDRGAWSRRRGQHVQRGKSPTQPETEGLAQASLSLGPLGAQSSLGARRSPPPRPLSPRLWKLQGPPPAPAQSWWDDSPLALRWGLRISLVSRPKLGRRGAETLRPSVAGCHAGSSLEPQHKGPLSCLPHPGRTWQQPGPGGWWLGPLRPGLPPACVPKHGGGLSRPPRSDLPVPGEPVSPVPPHSRCHGNVRTQQVGRAGTLSGGHWFLQ